VPTIPLLGCHVQPFIVSDSLLLTRCKTCSRHRIFLCAKWYMINDAKSHIHAKYSQPSWDQIRETGRHVLSHHYRPNIIGVIDAPVSYIICKILNAVSKWGTPHFVIWRFFVGLIFQAGNVHNFSGTECFHCNFICKRELVN
jgi:hypothetical protein